MISPIREVTTLSATNLHLNSSGKVRRLEQAIFKTNSVQLQQTLYSVHTSKESDFQFWLN